jgi:hypothetical protein
VLLGLVGLVLLGALIAWRLPGPAPDAPQVRLSGRIDAAPMCPWREQDADLRAFFPGAATVHTEARILSAQRLELTRRLGRNPDPEEASLYLYRISRNAQPAGTVLVRRVKGEYGAIEVVVAVDPGGSVVGVRIQRLREPEEIARALRSPAWLGAFRGRTADGEWTPLPDVPASARESARAVSEGVRSLLILREVAEARGLPVQSNHAHGNAPG